MSAALVEKYNVMQVSTLVCSTETDLTKLNKL